MLLQDARGNIVRAQLSASHSASRLGMPVLVLPDGTALLPGDIKGWSIIEATEGERRELVDAGYRKGARP